MIFITPLYYAYVRPILEYATPAWSYLKGNTDPRGIDHVEPVQCYFTRITRIT